MARIFQGLTNTISPAFGAYSIVTEINIDGNMPGDLTYTGALGLTGFYGVTGSNTLEPYQYLQGVTGIQGNAHNNSNWMY